MCTAFEDDYARIVSIARAKVEFVEPMLALAVTTLPEGPAWSYELKFDGYRVSGRRTALTLGQGSEIHSRFKES